VSDEVKVGTCGFDHVGLSVRDLAISRKFFCDFLGWRVVGERPDYPAAFLSDGHCVLTLWEVASPDMAIAFDRRANVGLHSALSVVGPLLCLAAFVQRAAWLRKTSSRQTG
jgi:catechol 2,3-dioxygenase-like lactoylglutathione lyase family enzyme